MLCFFAAMAGAVRFNHAFNEIQTYIFPADLPLPALHR